MQKTIGLVGTSTRPSHRSVPAHRRASLGCLGSPACAESCWAVTEKTQQESTRAGGGDRGQRDRKGQAAPQARTLFLAQGQVSGHRHGRLLPCKSEDVVPLKQTCQLCARLLRGAGVQISTDHGLCQQFFISECYIKNIIGSHKLAEISMFIFYFLKLCLLYLKVFIRYVREIYFMEKMIIKCVNILKEKCGEFPGRWEERSLQDRGAQRRPRHIRTLSLSSRAGTGEGLAEVR